MVADRHVGPSGTKTHLSGRIRQVLSRTTASFHDVRCDAMRSSSRVVLPLPKNSQGATTICERLENTCIERVRDSLCPLLERVVGSRIRTGAIGVGSRIGISIHLK